MSVLETLGMFFRTQQSPQKRPSTCHWYEDQQYKDQCTDWMYPDKCTCDTCDNYQPSIFLEEKVKKHD